MRNSKEVAVNLALVGLLFAYIVAQSPTNYVYLRNYYRGLRYWMWTQQQSKWLLEALKVRGYI